MTYAEFEESKPPGMTDEEYVRSLPQPVLLSLAIDMRLTRYTDEYKHILDILDVLVPKYKMPDENV